MSTIAAVTALRPLRPLVPVVARRETADAAGHALVSRGRTDLLHADLAAPRGQTPAYGVAAYAAVEAMAHATRSDAAVELSVRTAADGGRVSVARRLEGPRTVGIEAVVA